MKLYQWLTRPLRVLRLWRRGRWREVGGGLGRGLGVGLDEEDGIGNCQCS